MGRLKLTISKFIEEFKKPILNSNPSFHLQSTAYMFGNMYQTMKFPFVFSLFAGISVFVLPDEGDRKSIEAISEFLQNTGGIIAMYLCTLLAGLIITFSRVKYLSNFFRWLLRFVSYAGHIIVTVTAGVAAGLIFPTLIEDLSFFKFPAMLYTLYSLIIIGIFFFYINKCLTEKNMASFKSLTKKTSENDIFLVSSISSFIVSNHLILKFLIGGGLIFASIWSLLFEHY